MSNKDPRKSIIIFVYHPATLRTLLSDISPFKYMTIKNIHNHNQHLFWFDTRTEEEMRALKSVLATYDPCEIVVFKEQ